MSQRVQKIINPIPIISYEAKKCYLDEMTFFHLIQYYKFKPSTVIAKAQKLSANTTGIKYKFGMQVPKRIKNLINLDEKNGNNLW
jgi:hypothetical protein